jgi:hypothetical protein
MRRRQIYLENEQDEAVRVEARRRGMTESAVIRECIGKHLEADARAKMRKAGDELLALLSDWPKRHPNGTLDKFDRESLYDESLDDR